MALDDELTIDQQHSIIDDAEREYRRNDEGWLELSEKYGEYTILEHPYTGAIENLGQALLFHLQDMESRKPKGRFAVGASEIMKKGGSIRFDRDEAYHSGEVSHYISEEHIPDVSDEAWGLVLIDHTRNILPMIEKALALPEDDPKIPKTSEELRILRISAQAYLIAKTVPDGIFSIIGSIFNDFYT